MARCSRGWYGLSLERNQDFYIDTRENVPALISPADGAVFDTFPPSFKWSTWPSCDYYLMIFKDSLWSKDTLFYDTFDYSYSSYTLPMTKLFSADTGTYAWTVGVKDTLIDEIIYPSPRIFKIKNTYFPVDLDTTYFPFDLGYEWCFKRHDWGMMKYTHGIGIIITILRYRSATLSQYLMKRILYCL